MSDRVNFSPPNFISLSIDWRELVEKPFTEGYIIQAFASADAIIDNFIESCLRQIYEDFKCQDLINELHLFRSKTNFDGLAILNILKSKTIIDDKFCEKVLNFKKARNLVSHNKEGEYSLIIGNPAFKYSSQEDLNNLVIIESKKWIKIAYELFVQLIEISKTLSENKDYYFSEKFYRENPRGQTPPHKTKFPK